MRSALILLVNESGMVSYLAQAFTIMVRLLRVVVWSRAESKKCSEMLINC